jgi:8-amino-7-oxononanoate synthase
MSVEDWEHLEIETNELRQQDLWRDLRIIDDVQGSRVQSGGRWLVNFSSNDYLGLAGSEFLQAALEEGVREFGAGSGASRLVCGTHRVHHDLEAALAAFKGTEAALTFSSGFATAMGTIPALVGKGDTIILDKLCHACLVDAARLSGATLRVFPHNHLEKLERLLSTATGRVLVVTESIFSMDGDAAALREITDLKDQFGAWLLVDEAHAVGSIGPSGRGLAAELGLESKIELQMGTLSKALGLSGGYLAASKKVIDWLVNRARSFVYSTAPPPALAFAAAKALEWCQSPEGDAARHKLRAHIASLADELKLPPPTAAILPIMVGEADSALSLSHDLRNSGYLIPAIRYPTVERGKARLRVTLSAAHREDEIAALARLLRPLVGD